MQTNQPYQNLNRGSNYSGSFPQQSGERGASIMDIGAHNHWVATNRMDKIVRSFCYLTRGR